MTGNRSNALLPTAPADLELFWRARYARTLQRDVRPRIVADEGVQAGIRYLSVEFFSTDDVMIGAWITMPDDGVVDRSIVRLHGYGGLAAASVVHPALPRTAVIWPCLRGMPALSRSGRFPDNSTEHVVFGIESRDTYIHGGCVEDAWSAISALTALFPDAAARIDLVGGSFGGGIGAIATAWDARIRSAVLEVPSFGNHPARVRIPCEGSGQAVREYWLRDPSVLDVLAYFDAASCARFIDVPVLIAPALTDPAVPPAGQWSVYDAVRGRKELFTLTAGHMPYQGDGEEHAALEAATLVFLSDSRDAGPAGRSGSNR